MQKLDKSAAREIAKSDLAPGFAVLSREKPLMYKYDEKAFMALKDNELLGLVEEYSTLVRKGMGWKASVAKVYEKARADMLKGFR